MSSFIWQEKESRRTAHQRRKHEREVQAQQTQAFLSNVTSGVEPPPFDLVLDQKQSERRLHIPEGCMGLVIGKKGEHVKSVEKDFKVNVKIEKDESSSDSIVLVSGASPAEVAAAAKELDFDMRTLEVPKELAGWVCGKAGRHLKLIREMTGVAVLSMKNMDESEPGQSDPVNTSSRCSLDIKGLRESVEAAVMCMEAHMSYHSVFQEMDQVEKELDQQIADARGRLSRRAVSSNAGTHAQSTQSRGAKGRSKSPASRRPRPEGDAAAAKQLSGRTGRVWAGAAEGGVIGSGGFGAARTAKGRGRNGAEWKGRGGRGPNSAVQTRFIL